MLTIPVFRVLMAEMRDWSELLTFYPSNIGKIAGNERPRHDMTAPIRDERLVRFYTYWLARKGDRRFPARRDIDPLDFPYLLGRVMMFEVLPDLPQFRVRLHGTELATQGHYDLTGKFLDAMPDPEFRALVTARCESLVAKGEPLIIRRTRVLHGKPRPYEALWLPLSEDGIQVTHLVTALIYDDDRAPGTPQPCSRVFDFVRPTAA